MALEGGGIDSDVAAHVVLDALQALTDVVTRGGQPWVAHAQPGMPPDDPLGTKDGYLAQVRLLADAAGAHLEAGAAQQWEAVLSTLESCAAESPDQDLSL